MCEAVILIEGTSRREVFCSLRSIGHTEFYEAYATEYRPELKFVLSDYLDYEGETLVKHGAELYRVLRTYRTGQELELTVGRASAEEVALYG
jgi:hypothetical protein